MGTPKFGFRAKFNDPSDPTYEFENQCTAFVRSCPSCGNRFGPGERVCTNCGTARPRCHNRAMEGEEVCRAHATGRPYSPYTKVASMLTETALEELIEMDDRDLSEEYALARAAIVAALEQGTPPTSKELMELVKDFFTISEKKKNIEKGQILNVAFDDKMVNALRVRIRAMMRAINEVLTKYISDEDLRKRMLSEIKELTRVAGNAITVPFNPSDFVQTQQTAVQLGEED